MQAMAGELLSQSEAARRAKVNRSTIYEWLKSGKLTPVVRPIDGRKFVDADELARKTTPKPPPAASSEA